MNDATHAAETLAQGAPPRDEPQAPPGAHRGRLFRKYLTLILSLVTLALLVSGATSVYFTYQETRSSLASLQYEKALGAASRIEQYMRGIEQQLTYAALPQLDAGDIEQRRIEFLKLLRQAPEVTDIAQLDATGRERLAVSRLGMDAVDSGKDRSSEPAFRNATRARTWFGPVYFRKETEPYMTMAVRPGGDKGPVTIADVNLKFIWDVVSRIKVGAKGKAYVVDDRGFLVADPDIGLVLRKTNLANLAHVKAALAGAAPGELAMLSNDLSGARVLTAMAPIGALDWKVFVEQPASEVYAKLNASILRTGLLLLAGLVISALAAWALARNMVRPIRTLEDGARKIGAGDLDQRIDVRTGDELEALAGQFNRMSSRLKESYAGLERKVEARTHELQNALEQQTAISEILRVISSSPTDVQPVLQAVAERAAHLCNAPFARVMVIDGDMLRPAADYSTEPVFSGNPVPLARTSITGRAVVDRATVHFADVAAVAETEFPGAVDNIRRLGCRAVLTVPLLREGGAYGGIFLFRREPGLFSADQVALVQTFARQAAIAIDNVRLFNETKEALEKQTAISEILRVISSSPTDVQPVFDIISERARKLCDAEVSIVSRVEGNMVRLAAVHGVTEDGLGAIRQLYPIPVSANTVTTRAIRERAVVQVEDVLADPTYYARDAATKARFRGSLCVPMLREAEVIGAIYVAHRDPGRFTDGQVELLKTFADQGVIAVENVRLLNETKEALEHQKASAEVLGAISSSIADTRPVFDEILQSCQHLFNGHIVGIVLIGEDGLGHDAGFLGASPDALKGVFPVPLTPDSGTGSAILARRVMHYPDAAKADVPASTRRSAALLGFHSALFAPLLLDDRTLGVLWVGRSEPAPFSDKQIALLETFADQAVIAIENARLFNETKEALDQQTAISEILRVISGSPGDVKPMLNAVAERALKLCDATQSTIVLVDGDELRFAARFGKTQTLDDGEAMPLTRGSVTGRAVIDRQVIHLDDLATVPEEEYPIGRELQRRIGHHAILSVPLMREDHAIGAIALWRMEPRKFSDKQIALVKTFADQAAIAIENVRLFNETKEALERQTAMSEILRVISRSPTDVQPVFDTIAAAALGLCDAISALVFTYDGTLIHLAANANVNPEDEQAWRGAFPRPPSRETATARAILTGNVAMIPDVLEDPEYTIGEMAVKTGFRSALAVPLIRDERPIGVIGVGRPEPGPFRENQIAILQTFADQAVIAIENVRLFNETKEALDQQTAVAEILRVISSSPTDVQPVLDAIAEHAAKLCDASAASMYLISGGALRHLASKGPSPDPVTHVDTLPINRDSLTGRAVLERHTIQLPDLLAEAEEYPLSHEIARLHGHRTVVVTPLLREGQPFGAILLRRQEVRPFNEREVALLSTFGDQAAIALENVRLFNETKEALEQQRASGEVLAAISSSIADTAPVFETILTSCERLFAGRIAVIDLVGEDGLVHLGAYHGPRQDDVRRLYPHAVDTTTATGAALAARGVVHYPRVEHLPPIARQAFEVFGIQAAIGAPMIWENNGIGAIWVARDRAGPFSDKEIALLKSFADQAVIAIQNARLFHEIDEKSRQLEIANKHKSEFLANMSHELRTPLNAIIGFSEVLLERLFGEVNEKQDDYLKDIHSSGKHLLSLINDILDLSKIEAGRMELEPSSFDLSAAVSNALTLFRERAQRHGIALAQQVDPALGDIVADERKFKQILLNLLSNAVKFTPDGGRIDVTARRVDGAAEIAVRDTGIGIAPEDQAAVFEEFRQVGHDYTKKQEGTGLGLALTRKFVELHGGRIRLESEPGKGSTFTFTIPLTT